MRNRRLPDGEQVAGAVVEGLDLDDLGQRAHHGDVRRRAAGLTSGHLGPAAQDHHSERCRAARALHVDQQPPVARLEDVQRQRHGRHEHVAQRKQRDHVGHHTTVRPPTREQAETSAARLVNWAGAAPPRCHRVRPGPQSRAAAGEIRRRRRDGRRRPGGVGRGRAAVTPRPARRPCASTASTWPSPGWAPRRWRTALAELDPAVRAALSESIRRARIVHEAQRRETVDTQVVPGGTVTERWVPVRAGRPVRARRPGAASRPAWS